MHCNVALLIYVSKSLILQEASAGISNENLRINFQGTTVVVSKYVYSIVIKEALMLAALSMSYVATWVSRKSKITCLVI